MEQSGLGVTSDLPFESAVTKARISLRAEGFSILSEMPAPLKPGEGIGRRHLFIAVWQQPNRTANLGGAGLDVGDHLSCPVAVYEQRGRTVVAALDPAEGAEGWEHEPEARAASQALEAMLGRVLND